MSNLTPEQFSLLIRQSNFITYGLNEFLYGMHTILVAFLIYFYWTSPSQNKQKSTKIFLGLIVFMWILQTVHNVCNIYESWVAFIQYGDTADETTAVLDGEIITRPLVAIYAVGPLLATLRLTTADGIMVWRCWIVSGGSWAMTILPLVLNIGSFATGITFTGLWLSPSSSGGVELPVDIDITSISLSVATTVLCTLFISIRILQVTRLPGATRQPRSAVEIIVESALLYSITALVYIPTIGPGTGTSSTYDAYVNVLWAHMTNFAPVLIMLRVALGRARPDVEWTGKTSGLGTQQNSRSPRGISSRILSTLRFESHHVSGCDVNSDIEAGTTPASDMEYGSITTAAGADGQGSIDLDVQGMKKTG